MIRFLTSPNRPANRIGIIVGVLLLGLLLIGGGFAWLAYSSANNIPPHATPSATGAAQHFTAKGPVRS